VDDVLHCDTGPVPRVVELCDEGRHPNAAADCAESSEPRKNTIFPSAKRHQCCMYIDAVLPVDLTVNVQWTIATTSPASLDVNETRSNSVMSTFDPISSKNRGTSALP